MFGLKMKIMKGGRFAMKKNITSKLWFIAAIGFIISGILAPNSTFIILGCTFTIFGFQHMK